MLRNSFVELETSLYEFFDEILLEASEEEAEGDEEAFFPIASAPTVAQHRHAAGALRPESVDVLMHQNKLHLQARKTQLTRLEETANRLEHEATTTLRDAYQLRTAAAARQRRSLCCFCC